MLDIGIARERSLEAVHLRLGLGDRRVLRQRQVDEQFGPVGAREELVLHEADAHDRERRTGRRDADGEPAPAHGNEQHAREARPPQPRCRQSCCFIVLRQERDAESGVNSTATTQVDSSAAAITTNSVKVYSPADDAVQADRHEARDRDQRARQHRKAVDL